MDKLPRWIEKIRDDSSGETFESLRRKQSLIRVIVIRFLKRIGIWPIGILRLGTSYLVFFKGSVWRVGKF